MLTQPETTMCKMSNNLRNTLVNSSKNNLLTMFTSLQSSNNNNTTANYYTYSHDFFLPTQFSVPSSSQHTQHSLTPSILVVTTPVHALLVGTASLFALLQPLDQALML